MRPESSAWCCAGSLDRTVKLWDLDAGMQIATSRFQPCGVRALALDPDMLVCSASKVTFLTPWECMGTIRPLSCESCCPLIRGIGGPRAERVAVNKAAPGRTQAQDRHTCLLSALSLQLETWVALVLRSMQGFCPAVTMHKADDGSARIAFGIVCFFS